MGILRAFNEVLVKIGSWGTVIFVAIIAVVIPYEVVGRYILGKMTIWSGEVSTYSLAWASMLGGAVGLRKGYQVVMSTLVDALPSKLAGVLRWTNYTFSLFFFGVMFAWGLYQTLYNLKQTSPAIGLVMALPYASLPAGFLIMFFLTLEDFLTFLSGARTGEET